MQGNQPATNTEAGTTSSVPNPAPETCPTASRPEQTTVLSQPQQDHAGSWLTLDGNTAATRLRIALDEHDEFTGVGMQQSVIIGNTTGGDMDEHEQAEWNRLVLKFHQDRGMG